MSSRILHREHRVRNPIPEFLNVQRVQTSVKCTLNKWSFDSIWLWGMLKTISVTCLFTSSAVSPSNHDITSRVHMQYEDLCGCARPASVYRRITCFRYHLKCFKMKAFKHQVCILMTLQRHTLLFRKGFKSLQSAALLLVWKSRYVNLWLYELCFKPQYPQTGSWY